MTERQSEIIAAAFTSPDWARQLCDLAVLQLASQGYDVTRDEVRGALERSLVGLLDVREKAWKAAR